MLAKIYGHMKCDVINGSKTWQGTPLLSFILVGLLFPKQWTKDFLSNHTPLTPPTVKTTPLALMG